MIFSFPLLHPFISPPSFDFPLALSLASSVSSLFTSFSPYFHHSSQYYFMSSLLFVSFQLSSYFFHLLFPNLIFLVHLFDSPLPTPPSFISSWLLHHLSLHLMRAVTRMPASWWILKCPFIAKLFIKQLIVLLKIDCTMKVLFTGQTTPESVLLNLTTYFSIHHSSPPLPDKQMVFAFAISFTDQSSCHMHSRGLFKVLTGAFIHEHKVGK